MAQGAIPVNFSEIVNLTSLGVNAPCIKFGSCSMESDKFITVCDSSGDSPQVYVIDLEAGNTVTKRPISAEAAIMNPVSKVLALRAGSQLQIFNLELRAKMKSHTLEAACVFWRWTSPNNIALVTPQSVFHWSIEGTSEPVKVFDRHASLAEGTQIINYQVSADEKWCLLMGIAQGQGGIIQGTMQLYSIEKGVSQTLQGHTGCFHKITVPGRTDPAQVLCFEEKKPDSPAKIFVMEVGRDKDAPGGVFRLAPVPIPVPADAPNDFPVSMIPSPKHDIVFMITKMGYLYLFDIFSGKALYRARITNDTVFVTCIQSSTGGMLGITARKGQVLQVALNEQTLVPYVVSTLRDNALGIALASRLNLPGADNLYEAEFQRLLSVGDVPGAAKLAANSPQGLLRTAETIQRFQGIPGQPGQPQPVFQYFHMLLEKGKLNQLESIELAKPVLQQGRTQFLEKWLTEDKLECSEQLGDLVMQADVSMALSVYLRANVPEKAINCMLQRGEFDKIAAYATKVGYRCDYSFMLNTLVRQNPQGALEFAKQLASGNLIDPNQVVEIFMGANRIQETTAFLLEALKDNKPEEGYLQTKLLEINLRGGSPQVADAILQNNMFTHYDRQYVAKMCEAAGLAQRALEHYTDVEDIKRSLLAMCQNQHNVNPEFVLSYFGSLSPEASLECLKELLSRNMHGNMQIVTQIAAKYNEQIGSQPLIDLFESFKGYEALYYYLGQIVNFSQEPLVHFKYIEAAAKCQQFKEVERVCRDSTVYEPIAVKDFLMEAKLPDPRPLIHVCDRHGFVEEMTQYLYSSNLTKYIEVYCNKVSPQQTPVVVGKLLDLDCNEDFIRGLLNSVGHACPVEELVVQVEHRNRLRLLQPWLEARIATGNTEMGTHNAIGKIYVTLNRDPVSFLTNDQYYDPKVLGKYCEKLDPSLAFLAYKRANGECDDDLIRVTRENGLFKDLARYLVERQDLELWATVLQASDEPTEDSNRRALIDQVVQTALPETKDPDHVSTTVKAFMAADLPQELIELLERIVLHGSDFSENKNLQNLLILTAIKADKERVMEYINRLDNFDGPEIAKIAISDQYELYEEGFIIYNKFAKQTKDIEEATKLNVCAVGVLVDMIQSLERASEFAERVNVAPVWSRLAKAQLDEGLMTAAIASYIKAGDPTSYREVIEAAERADSYEALIPFLVMSRKQIKEPHLDTMLIYSYAKSDKLGDLEEFIAAPNVASIQNIGERCFDEGMFSAAKILFASINNNAKLALCYVNLEQYREAVDAAQKANSVSTWKEINKACVKASEFRLARTAGLHIIIHPDHLEELISLYENEGQPMELIQLMEQGLGLDGAHSGIFTELGVLYSKYLHEKLMEHIKIFWSRMNTPKLMRACEKALLWDEAVFLLKEDEQYDSAVKTMIAHATAFQHDLFLDCVQKVRNTEVYYKSIAFYIEQQPLSLNRLLQVLTPNLDHSRVVHQLRKLENLPLALPYLKSVQKSNLSAVNEAINEMYVEDEDYDSLRQSIDDHDNFDQIALAQKVEKHELLEFRRIATYLYKKNKRYQKSIALSKADKSYKDAIETAAESGDPALAEEMLRFFCDVCDKECFCATLYTCYQEIKPDVAIELAWRNNYADFVMPYIIQYARHLHDKVEALEKKTSTKEAQETAESDANAAAAAGMMYDNYNGPPMLTAGPGMMPEYAPQPQMGMPPMPQAGMGPQIGMVPPGGPMPGYGMPPSGQMPPMGF
mmetsp:Transcript_20888/g.27094  ORF Transcript_20888/g.27094 Transcript_20888/m.27094 type:complete len:1733 (+) Transcript_20888:121-5319(+)|eukprot:CAMPEP_0197288054 /NCGR_PEP_ID=MMETSP0890-20130614/4957_1 /TAXON_ID=44058 ORGANISM="Aureoumbra lagunensis, Strain CCMP1510" /NCGR_SAMPLE_ID=MMETSP0890 /ASSEMBLY_ACC=CAM_ASM_000533 /LENGTH=1732 /DNA_ID=CAMNT_0042758437 /DNA_START=113 /DNA_END=5311 /DNA_ORIENTATION=+